MNASSFGWQLSLTRDPDWQWKQLARRVRGTVPGPAVFAVLVAVLLVGTLALAAWAETPYAPAVIAGVVGEASV
jgi:hypothetical protein